MEQICLMTPYNNATVSLQTDVQRRFWEAHTEKETLHIGEEGVALTRKGCDSSRPLPVFFSWQGGAAPYTLQVAETSDFAAPLCCETEQTEYALWNLKTGQDYYWRVNGSEVFRFDTEFSPRWILAEGMVNIRDIGSLPTADGRRIRQGMVYRGPRFENTVTEQGIARLRALGIRTELDLRDEAVGVLTQSPLGEDVGYVQLTCKGYDDFILGEGAAKCKALFEFLANPAVYPVYFHCAGGNDRTGTLAFLLEAVLGCSEETALRDYELSVLQHQEAVDMRRTRWGHLLADFLAELQKPLYGEGDYCARGLKALAFCGVSEQTLQAICDILLL